MAKARRAQKIRTSEEFVATATTQIRRRPTSTSNVHGWTEERIYAARNAQLRGDFRQAAKLSEAMQTDDSLYVARGNRLAPHRAIGVKIEPADKKNPKALRIAEEAEALFGQRGIGVTLPSLINVGIALVDHGVAFMRITRQVRTDGSRVDMFANYWPIEHVRWDEYRRAYLTYVETENGAIGPEVEIRHGDGEWIVIASVEHQPWKLGVIVSGAVVWACHAIANRDWSKGSTSHGNAKVIGEMAPSIPLQKTDGSLTYEAAAFLELLRDIASSDSPVGIKPTGSTVQYLTNNGTAWQVWKELSEKAAKAAARIYLGTDGVLGAAGGAPGVDITALFGVAATLVQGDLETIEACLLTGLLEPWCAVNFGDSSLTPRRTYLIPRPEEESEIEDLTARTTAFHGEVKAAKENEFAITQEWINKTAAKYRVDAPDLPATLPATPGLKGTPAPATAA